MNPPQVRNIRVKNLRPEYASLEEWLKDPSHLYIGRNMSFYVTGAEQSKWANPFSEKKYGRDECLKRYREHVLNSDLKAQLNELEGKVLGCWCAPEPCHGDVLVELYTTHVK